MKVKQALLISGLSLAGALFVTLPAFAQFTSCSVSTSIPVSFDSYDVFSGSSKTTAGRIEYNCNVTVSATVSLSKGNAPTYNPRQMRNTLNESLNYNLYITPELQTIWGDDTGGTVTQTTPNKITYAYSVFGVIPPRQDVRFGNYTDTVTVTINF